MTLATRIAQLPIPQVKPEDKLILLISVYWHLAKRAGMEEEIINRTQNEYLEALEELEKKANK
jgi:hypothetical protein